MQICAQVLAFTKFRWIVQEFFAPTHSKDAVAVHQRAIDVDADEDADVDDRAQRAPPSSDELVQQYKWVKKPSLDDMKRAMVALLESGGGALPGSSKEREMRKRFAQAPMFLTPDLALKTF